MTSAARKISIADQIQVSGCARPSMCGRLSGAVACPYHFLSVMHENGSTVSERIKAGVALAAAQGEKE